MSKVSHIRKACEDKLALELEALKKHRASGLKVLGYTCHAFPPAVAAGLGLWPVRVLCGATSDAESTGEKIVRADVCPQVKSLLGNVSKDAGLHGEVDIWAGLYTCDQMRRGLNCLQQSLGKEVHSIQLPATRTKEAAGYYALQVRRMVTDLETQGALRFDTAGAMKWQGEYEAAAAVLSRAGRSAEISPFDLHAMFHLFFVARPEGLAEFFRKLISSSPKFRSKKSIMLCGSPLAAEDTILLEVLEEQGFSAVLLNCTGLNAVEESCLSIPCDDQITSLALEAFHKPPCARARPNSSVYERISESIQSSESAGLIVKCLKFCDHWYTERERLRRKFDLPVMVFDSDYAVGGREWVRSRIDAFLETLDE
jgi:benzoyl-CoA reductase/2-hydroxyglutaryl-CoA dehydratase subunit BcrC/BadD/HgdB